VHRAGDNVETTLPQSPARGVTVAGIPEKVPDVARDRARLLDGFPRENPSEYVNAKDFEEARRELVRLRDCGQDLRGPLLAAAENRRSQADALMWQLPTISLTAQAFLLTIIANSSVSDGGRLLTSVAALVFAAGAFETLLQHRRNEELLSRWLEIAEILWELPRFHDFRRMEHVARIGPAPEPEKKSRWLRSPLFLRIKAFSFWAGLLFFVTLADLALVLYFGIRVVP
jgi:hypothetical protein